MIILFPVLGAVFLILFLKGRIHEANASTLIFKTLTSVCFLGLSVYGVWKAGSSGVSVYYSVLITTGLFFGLLGDIWLDLKYNCPNESDPFTFAGFWCFAVGHVFFLIGMIGFMNVNRSVLSVIIPIIVAAICGIAVGMGGKLLSLDYGKFKTITMFYGALLISSVFVSASLLFQSGFSSVPLWLFFVGAVLFLASDLVLSGTYFGTGKNRPVDIVSNHILYYAGQFLIAASSFAFALS